MPGELTAWLSASESKFFLSMLRLCEQRERGRGFCVPRGDYSCVVTIYSLCLRRTEYNYTQLFENKLFFNCRRNESRLFARVDKIHSVYCVSQKLCPS
jgi:hypothetical protein